MPAVVQSRNSRAGTFYGGDECVVAIFQKKKDGCVVVERLRVRLWKQLDLDTYAFKGFTWM
jgi:hypothetical protein